MENKYYTPNIEEFYTGFEYEYSYPTWPNNQEDKSSTALIEVTWYKEKFTTQNQPMCRRNPIFINTWISNGYIRVKYLDEEDILSLGFEKTKLPHRFTKNNYVLIDLDKNLYKIEDTRYQRECIFNDKIKNKSELVKLLKQLEIK